MLGVAQHHAARICISRAHELIERAIEFSLFFVCACVCVLVIMMMTDSTNTHTQKFDEPKSFVILGLQIFAMA